MRGLSEGQVFGLLPPLLTILLGGLAVGVIDPTACLTILAHEEREVHVATLALGIAAGCVLLGDLLEFKVSKTNLPELNGALVVVLGILCEPAENTVVLLV